MKETDSQLMQMVAFPSNPSMSADFFTIGLLVAVGLAIIGVVIYIRRAWVTLGNTSHEPSSAGPETPAPAPIITTETIYSGRPQMPINENAVVKLNGHGFRFLLDVLKNIVFARLEETGNTSLHPLNRALEKFPGLKELVAQDQRPECTFNIEFSDDAIVDIRSSLLEAILKTRDMLEADENDPRPALFFNVSGELKTQLDELLYFAFWFRAELPDDLSERATQIVNERLRSEKPDRFQLSVSDWTVPRSAREEFRKIVSGHLDRDVSDDIWLGFRQYALNAPFNLATNPTEEDVDPDLTREALVKDALQEVSGIRIEDYMVGNFRDTARIIGLIEDMPVYYIEYGGFYVYQHPCGYLLQIDISHPIIPPGW